MNIKRMASEYRIRVRNTGFSLRKHIIRYLLEYSSRKNTVGNCRTDIKRWYNHLSKSLGSEKDLKDLHKVWEYLVKLSELCGEDKENLDPQRKLIVEKIQKQMNKFLEKLPRLIEKSLTRSVRESGIRLR